MMRYEELMQYLKQYKRAIVAFSGGIDSYLVLKACVDSIGQENVLAVTADSPSLKQKEKGETKRLAELIRANHKIIFTDEIDDPKYYDNPTNRCYFCKDELYTKLDELRASLGYDVILDGTNFDDMSDYRPGYKASKNHEILSPLVELKFTKDEIRGLSKSLGLEIWNKPSSPCLSSRIPYGQKVTLDKLSAIERAEAIVESLGFREFRVRHFEFDKPGKSDRKMTLAKIDISDKEMDKLKSDGVFDELNSKMKAIGYDFVTVDLGGLKSGSMNVMIELPVHNKN
jgi:pyridinium-3,5-biscarboxylic acid mononucleotide sulfurtransferase